jgi:hypothetical protein
VVVPPFSVEVLVSAGIGDPAEPGQTPKQQPLRDQDPATSRKNSGQICGMIIFRHVRHLFCNSLFWEKYN